MSEVLTNLFEEINDRLAERGSEANLSDVCWETVRAMEKREKLALVDEHGGTMLQQLYNSRYKVGLPDVVEESQPRRVPPNKGVKTGGKPTPKRIDYGWMRDYWVALSNSESRQKRLSEMTRDDVKSRIEMLTSHRDGLSEEIKKWSSLLGRLRSDATVGSKFTHEEILALKLGGLKPVT